MVDLVSRVKRLSYLLLGAPLTASGSSRRSERSSKSPDEILKAACRYEHCSPRKFTKMDMAMEEF
jgi:hypothetical protein